MKDKILTVIVPAYNVEKYIDECLKSFVSPVCDERLEVLVINDGSTDDTFRIANDYAERYENIIRVISKENGGHGSTINRGLDEASGKYVKVIDGDDYIVNTNLEEFLDVLDKYDADAVISAKINFYEGSEEKEAIDCGIESDCIVSIDKIAQNWGLNIHQITIKTELIKGVIPRIDEHCFYVDQEFTLYYLPFIKTVKAFSLPLYCYRLGNINQSVSTINLFKRRENLNTVIKSMLRFYDSYTTLLEEHENLHKFIDNKIAKQINNYFNIVLSSTKSEKRDYDNVGEYVVLLKNNYQRVYSCLPKNPYYKFYTALPHSIFKLLLIISGKKTV